MKHVLYLNKVLPVISIHLMKTFFGTVEKIMSHIHFQEEKTEVNVLMPLMFLNLALLYQYLFELLLKFYR